MKSVKTLFNQKFTVTANGDGAVGNVIETFLGASINCNKGADLGFWEVKTKQITSNSKVTLNCVGKRGGLDELIGNAINKMKNVIYVLYSRVGNVVTVEQVYILYSLDETSFRSKIGGIVKLETRSSGEKSLRIAKGYLPQLYRQVTKV